MHTENWIDKLKIGDLVSIAHGIDKVDVGVVEAIEDQRILVGWPEQEFSLFFNRQGNEIEDEQEGGFYTGAVSKIIPFKMEDYKHRKYTLAQSLADFISEEIQFMDGIDDIIKILRNAILEMAVRERE